VSVSDPVRDPVSGDSMHPA